MLGIAMRLAPIDTKTFIFVPRYYSGKITRQRTFLFLIYIYDLPFYVMNLCDSVLFADDTSLVIKVERNRMTK